MLLIGGMVVACGEDERSVSSEEIVQDLEKRRAVERRIDALGRELRRAREQDAGRRAPERPVPSQPGVLAGFDAFARELAGQVGVTVGPPGWPPKASGGALASGSAWSTIKVPIALRVLEDAGGPDALTAVQQTAVERAITASDNAAAAELFNDLAVRYGGVQGAARAVTESLRAAGDEDTEVSTQGRDGFSPYGQTGWPLVEQHRFMAALAGGCVGTRASRDYLLGLMGRVSSDSWGLGSAGVPGRWKGGWGPGTDGRYLVRQMGVLTLAGGRELVTTLAARPADGQLASGQLMATRLAQWLARHAAAAAGPPAGC